jgi:hypothetical protein
MKKFILLVVLCLTNLGLLYSQDSIPAAEEKKPLTKAPFESGICMDNLTVSTPPAQTLEFVLQHRFGSIQGGIHNIYGIWGATNIRVGANYSINKNVIVGFGTTKYNMYQDFSVKYTFFRQRDGGFPLTLAYFFDIAINATNKSTFGQDYSFQDRLSYFNQLMVARRFCRIFSAEVNFAFQHYNKVDSLRKNDAFVLGIVGRLKVSPQTSVVASYSWPVMLGYDKPFILKYGQNDFYYGPERPLWNANLGVEFSTSTHVFHLFFGASQGIVPQDINLYNQNNFWNGEIVIGFNLTRLWTF